MELVRNKEGREETAASVRPPWSGAVLQSQDTAAGDAGFGVHG